MLCLSGFELYSRWVPLSHAYTFQTPFSYTNALNFSFFPRISREWDQLPAKVVLCPSLAVFKKKAITSVMNYNPK